jgi:hypothetical protein
MEMIINHLRDCVYAITMFFLLVAFKGMKLSEKRRFLKELEGI